MFKTIFKLLCVALLLATAPLTQAATPAKTFATPDAAAQALADAVRAQDKKQLLAVVGPDAESWLFSGDTAADRNDWGKFLAAYTTKHSISMPGDTQAFLLVGEDDWPFPAPIVKKGTTWAFDANAGRQEILNRRVGRNELDTIQTLLAIVDAQREYAMGDADGNGFHDYAQRFLSTTGTKDGLYWPTAAGQPLSPLGAEIAAATNQGYKTSAPQPGAYHGYRFRMLKAQGKDAKGGAYSYMVGKHMIGGFAVIAYPAKYGVSGIMSFIVNHDGTVYQKDLGKTSEESAIKMSAFNPDASWKKQQ